MNKFRLWNKREKKMVYNPDVDNNTLLAIGLHGLPIAIDRDSLKHGEIIGWNVDHIYGVLQYTGLKDVNNNMVYEGDIVKINVNLLNMRILGKVIFKDGCFTCICPIVPNDDIPLFGVDKIQILGNIYENPELLNGETE